MLYLLVRELEAWLSRQGLYRYVRVIDQLEFRALFAAILAFFIVLLLGKPTIAWLARKKIGDAGLTDAALLENVTKSKANVPTMGGVLIVGAIAGTTLLLADVGVFYVLMGLLVLLWLAALGAADDWLKLTAATRQSKSRQGLFAWEKLIFQLGLGVLVGYFAYRHGTSGSPEELAHVLNLPFQRTYEPGGSAPNPNLVFFPLGLFIVWTSLFIAGVSNAVNITDGMDGLAAGTSTVVSVGLTVLAFVAGTQSTAQYLLVPYIPGAGELTVMAGATAGACLGFLWWNCSPARVFMGDTGALALGGIIGYIALVTRQEFVVLLMCGVFLIEIGSVILQVGYFKATGGKRIFRVAPYHHHLHLLSWPEQQIVARAWIVSVLLVVVALATIKLR